jgi:hypothetical protein
MAHGLWFILGWVFIFVILMGLLPWSAMVKTTVCTHTVPCHMYTILLSLPSVVSRTKQSVHSMCVTLLNYLFTNFAVLFVCLHNEFLLH